ncbi:hypothetical protein [Parafrankia discariae]|uniref:hypothetical protein n=1 Tax=Parafrankia discariae TaxID=365528 RepID=UPI0003613825|nr:hypothetical protein [Parafrankia discariae]
MNKDQAAAQQLQRRFQDPATPIGAVLLIAVLVFVLLIAIGRLSVATSPESRVRLGMQAALGVSFLLFVTLVSATKRLIILGRRGRSR